MFLELEESAISSRCGRNGGSVLTRDQSDCNDAAKIEHSLFKEKHNAIARRQHGRCRLAERAQALAVPGRVKQQFVTHKKISQKAAS